MSNDNSKLDYHIKLLLVSAISKYRMKKEQAKALGISGYMLNKYCKKFNIKQSGYYD